MPGLFHVKMSKVITVEWFIEADKLLVFMVFKYWGGVKLIFTHGILHFQIYLDVLIALLCDNLLHSPNAKLNNQ